MSNDEDDHNPMEIERLQELLKRGMDKIARENEAKIAMGHKIQPRDKFEGAFLMFNPNVTVSIDLGEQLYLSLRDLADSRQMDVHDYVLFALRSHAKLAPGQ